MKSLSASLTYYCPGKHSAKAGETKRSEGVLLGALFPPIRSRPNFGTNSKWCAVLLRAPHRDAKHSLTQSLTQKREYKFTDNTRAGKTMQTSNLDPVLLGISKSWTAARKPAACPVPPLSGLHTGFVMEVHILALVPVQKWLDFPLPCDLCR